MDETLKQVLAVLIPFLGVGLPVLGLIMREAGRAQRILNTNYEKALKRLDDVENEADQLRHQLSSIKEQYAEERGGLRQQITDLERQMMTERMSSESRSNENAKEIATQAERLRLMKEAQTELEANIKTVTDDRNRIADQLNVVNLELVELRKREEGLLQRVAELTQQLLDKQSELETYQHQLNGPQ